MTDERTPLVTRALRALGFRQSSSPLLPRSFAGGPSVLAEVLRASTTPTTKQPPTETSDPGQPHISPSIRLQPGQEFGPYTIENRLSVGGMGTVYKALRRDDGKIVALKIARTDGTPNDTYRKRLQNEAQTLARLHHPNIAGFVDSGEVDEVFYLASEFIPGTDLLSWSRRERRTAEEILRVATQVSDALVACHHERIVHRDLTPTNIVITEAGRPIVVDFGLGHDLDLRLPHVGLTKTHHVPGKFPYIPPEHSVGTDEPPQPSWDLYAFGGCLYAAWSSEDFGPRQAHDLFPSLGAADDEFTRKLKLIARKCLAPNPKHRFASAAALRDELHTALNPPPRWRGQLLLAVSASLIVLLFSLTQFAGTSAGSDESTASPIRTWSHVLHLGMLILFFTRSLWVAKHDEHHLELPRFMPAIWFTFIGYYAWNIWWVASQKTEAWFHAIDATISNLTGVCLWLAFCALWMRTRPPGEAMNRRSQTTSAATGNSQASSRGGSETRKTKPAAFRRARLYLFSTWIALTALAALAVRNDPPDPDLIIRLVLLPSALFVGMSLCGLAVALGQRTLQTPLLYVLLLIGYGLIQILYPAFQWIETSSEGLMISVYGFGMIGKLVLLLSVETIFRSWALFGHEGQLSREW